MMKTIALSILLSVNYCVQAQNSSVIDKILSQKRVQTEKIDAQNTRTSTLITSDFSNETVKATKKLEDVTIVKAYYIYTSYKQSPSFNQAHLNQKRLTQLAKLVPNVVHDPYIEWEVIEQTGCTSPEEGQDYFHGFVLIHRPVVSEYEREKELIKMEVFLGNPSNSFNEDQLDVLEPQLNKSTAESIESVQNFRKAKYKEGNYALYDYLRDQLRNPEISRTRFDKWVKATVSLDEKGKVTEVEVHGDHKSVVKDQIKQALLQMSDWDPELKNGNPVATNLSLEIRTSYSMNVNGMYTIDGKQPSFTKSEMASKTGKDAEVSDEDLEKMTILESKPIYKSLEKLDSEKISIVMDVTASMNGELASLNWWIYNNTDTLRITSYSFFNDGNNMPDKKKKSGSIGGFYQAQFIGEVASQMMEAMRSGNGGDGQENDLEAVRFAINTDSKSDAILLIADNCSDVRDMSLLSSINKKVHVLICSNPKTVRTDYLDIAYNTGGDVIVDGRRYPLSNVIQGQHLFVRGTSYTLTSSGFKVDL